MVFKVFGEINIDDLLFVFYVIICFDIFFYVLVMLELKMLEGLNKIVELKQKGYLVVYVGDIVGIGLFWKFVCNLMLWYIGEDIFFIFNKCFGGYILGGKIVFIFFNIVEDFGVLFIECDVIKMEIGMVIIIYFYKGKIINEVGEIIFIFILKLEIIFEEV